MARKGMHNLRRNETEFEYFIPNGLESDLDENGMHTGDFEKQYALPVTYRGNISVPTGYASQNLFGTDVRYSHLLVMDDPDADISETGMIRWKGSLYEIRAVRPSINTLAIALRKKTEDHAESDAN